MVYWNILFITRFLFWYEVKKNKTFDKTLKPMCQKNIFELYLKEDALKRYGSKNLKVT